MEANGTDSSPLELSVGTEGTPFAGPESTTASTAKSDVALAHFLPGFSMSNNPAIVGTCSSIFMFVLERD